MLPGNFNTRGSRPVSEILKPGHYSEIDSLNHWYEDLQQYERNIDEMATASLDQNFKEELQHVDQWFRFLSEAERTATIFSLLQHSSSVQVRFFINLLQQMGKRDSIHTVLMTPNPDQTDMQTQFAGAIAKAEMEASQRLMSVLPYKTGQVISRPPPATARRQVDRHSFALGDTEDYTRQFLTTNGAGNNNSGNNGSGNTNNRYNSRPVSQTFSTNSLLTPNTGHSFNNSNNNSNNNNNNNATTNNSRGNHHHSSNNNRPRSVIEGDTSTLFSTPWANNASMTSSRRPMSVVGNIGDRNNNVNGLGSERPKSADISNWSFTAGIETMMEPRPANNNKSNYPNPWALGLDADLDFSTLNLNTSSYTNRGRNNNNNNNNSVNNTNGGGNRNSNIPNTVPENEESPSFKIPGSSSSLSRPTSPRPVSSNSTPFNNNNNNSQQHHHHSQQRKHIIPPGMDKQYNQFLTPMDHHHQLSSTNSMTMPLDGMASANDLINRRVPSSNSHSRSNSNLQSTSPIISHNNTMINNSNNNNNNNNVNTATNNSTTTTTTTTNSTTTVKEKKPEVIDMQLLQDVPAWFRSLRLHKYNAIFEPMKWQDIIKLTDADLEEKGVAALGARRKMLKVFENIKQHCEENNIEY
ncbi:unnamed protein product [Cunninghamella blakesleeana]